MAKLPGYDSQQGLTTQPGSVQRDINAEAQAGRNIQNIGKAAQDIASVWQGAKDFTETLKGQNTLDNGQNEIFKKAQLDPDYDNSAVYHEDLARVRDSSLEGFSSNLARQRFQVTAQNQSAAASIKIDGLFRSKLVDHGKAEIVRSHEKNHAAYIAGDITAKDKQSEVVANGFEKGFVNAVFVANEDIKFLDWEYDRAIYDAEKDPFTTLENIDSYDVPAGKKDDLVREIKQIAEIQVKKEDIAVLQTQSQTKKQYLETSDNRSLSDNLKLLEKGLEFKTMNKDWAESRRAALLSPLGIGAGTQNAYLAEVTELINEAEAAYGFHDDEKAATEYYKALEDAEVAVQVGIKNGLLSQTAAKKLNSMIYNKTGAGARNDVDSGLDRAISYFKEEIEGKDAQDAAIREYVYRVADKPGEMDMDRVLDSIRVGYLKKKDPSFKEADYKSMRDVRLINVGDTVINPLTLEQKILDKNGKWITIQ